MGQAEWDDFTMKGGIYMLYANNRPAGVQPSADEVTARSEMKTAFAALTAGEKLYYAGIGGPNWLLRYMQVTGGGRSTT